MLKSILLSFLLASLSYGKVQLPDYLEKGDLEKGIALMEGVVNRYERARTLYNKKGPEAFVNSLHEKLSEEDKKDILQMLVKLPELPKLSLKKDTLYFEFENVQRLEFKVSDVILGRFNSGNFSKRYNFNLSPKENWELLKVKNNKSALLKLFKELEHFALPLAYTSGIAPGRDVGIVTIGSLTHILILPKLGYVSFGPQDPHNH